MAQHPLTIPDSDGASFLAALNAALAALKTMNSGTGRPPSPGASQFWVDTNTPSATEWTLFMFDGADDIEVGTFDTVANRFTFAGSPIGRQLQWAATEAAARAAVGITGAGSAVATAVTEAAARDAMSAGLRLATAALSTSGTSIDFTGIPAGVRRITIMLNNVSTNGSSPIVFRVGTAGAGVLASGYTTGEVALTNAVALAAANSSTDFRVTIAGSGSVQQGMLMLSSIDSGTWVGQGSFFDNNPTVRMAFLAGRVNFTGPIDRVRITTAGGVDTFDAGSINIAWEF